MNEEKLAPVFMAVARQFASLATCSATKMVGAVLVSSAGYVVATGYNGSPHGQPHCDDEGCLYDETGSCIRAVHAEMNCLLQCAKRGVSSANTSLYVTHFPCPKCATALVQAGVVRVVWSQRNRDYAKMSLAELIMRQGGIVMTHIDDIIEAHDANRQ